MLEFGQYEPAGTRPSRRDAAAVAAVDVPALAVPGRRGTGVAAGRVDRTDVRRYGMGGPGAVHDARGPGAGRALGSVAVALPGDQRAHVRRGARRAGGHLVLLTRRGPAGSGTGRADRVRAAVPLVVDAGHGLGRGAVVPLPAPVARSRGRGLRRGRPGRRAVRGPRTRCAGPF